MKKYLQILRSEQVHFLRAPYKIVSFVLFLIAIIYGAQNGHDLFKKHQNEIASMRSKNEELVKQSISSNTKRLRMVRKIMVGEILPIPIGQFGVLHLLHSNTLLP